VGACHQPVAAVGRIEAVGMSGDKDPYADLKQHRWTAETRGLVESRVAFIPKRIQRRREQFVIVPWFWIERLSEARHISTYRVALHILHLNWKRRGQSFVLPNGMLKMEGVSRWGKWDALQELEQLKLIRIERRPRKSPVITVISQSQQTCRL
jgi:hypothetical protein